MSASDFRRAARARVVPPSAAAFVAATFVLLAALPAATLGAQTAPPAPLAPPAAQAGGTVDVDRVVAVVGTTPILYSELLDEVNSRRARGLQLPEDPAERLKLERDILNEMIDAELMVQKARDEKVEVSEDDLNRQVDQQFKQIRGQFPSETEFRNELRRAGLGTPEDYRRRTLELLRRSELQREVFQKLRRDQKLAPSPVTDQELTEAYEQSKATLPKREAQIGFKQIVVAARPHPDEKRRARAKAESLLVEVSKGGDFEQIAKRWTPARRSSAGTSAGIAAARW